MRRRARRANLVLLVIVVVVGGALYVRQRSRRPRPVAVTRQVRGERGVAPAPEFLLKHAAELKLTAQQRARVEEVAEAYRRDIGPTQEKLDRAAEQYQQYLKGAAKERHSAEELAAHGSEVQQLSAVVASTRRAYWEQAKGALDPSQRARAEELVKRARVEEVK